MAGSTALVRKILAITILFWAAADAQAAQPPVQKMEEVVVKAAALPGQAGGTTGAKTNTPLKNIPSSITVVPKEVVELQGGTSNVDYALRNVSGITQSSSSNYGFFNNYVVRGLNMNFLRDGIPDATTINGYSRSLNDVERVEVLKGPGSALYGSGSPGGSVNLISKEPLDTPRYEAMGSYGAYGTYETSADMTGPIIKDKLSYRFIADYYNSGGFRDVGRENFEILPTLKYRFSDEHTLTLDFDYRDIEADADTYGIPFAGSSLTQRNSLLEVDRGKKYYTPFGGTKQKVFRYAMRDEMRLNDHVLLRNNFVVLNRTLSLLRNAGGIVAAGASMMTGRLLRDQADRDTDYIYQFEPVFDFDTWDVHHKLLTGFEFQYHDIFTRRATAALPNIMDVYNPVIPETSRDLLTFVPNFERDINANYQSLYLQDQMDLTEQLKLRLGGRFDRFDTHVDSHLDQRTERRQDHPFSGQAGLVYRPIEPTSFYTGISSSKQAILSTESTAPLNRPEGALQYEVGNKTEFFEGKLNFDTSWFYVTRNDFLVTVGTDTFPVGKQRTTGVDFETTLKPLAGWYLGANYSYQNSRLLDVPQPSTSPAVNGNRAVGIPQNLFHLWTTYELQSGPFKGLGAGGGIDYRDSSFLNLQNTFIIPSYITGDLVIFYRRNGFEAQVNMRNVTNATYYRNGVNSGLLPGDPFGVYGTIRLRYPEATAK